MDLDSLLSLESELEDLQSNSDGCSTYAGYSTAVRLYGDSINGSNIIRWIFYGCMEILSMKVKYTRIAKLSTAVLNL